MIFNNELTTENGFNTEVSNLLEKRTITELTDNDMLNIDGGEAQASTPACLWITYSIAVSIYTIVKD